MPYRTRCSMARRAGSVGPGPQHEQCSYGCAGGGSQNFHVRDSAEARVTYISRSDSGRSGAIEPPSGDDQEGEAAGEVHII